MRLIVIIVSMLCQFPSGCTADLRICFLYVLKCNSVCIGHLFDQFIFLYKHLFVNSYTAKFVLDLLEIRKARFSHYKAHLSKIIQCYYSYLACKLLVPIYTIYFYFTRITKLMQVH